MKYFFLNETQEIGFISVLGTDSGCNQPGVISQNVKKKLGEEFRKECRICFVNLTSQICEVI